MYVDSLTALSSVTKLLGTYICDSDGNSENHDVLLTNNSFDTSSSQSKLNTINA